MTRFDYQVHVAVQIPGRGTEGHRLRTFVGSVKTTEEIDPVELGYGAAIEALQDATEQALEALTNDGRKAA